MNTRPIEVSSPNKVRRVSQERAYVAGVSEAAKVAIPAARREAQRVGIRGLLIGLVIGLVLGAAVGVAVAALVGIR